MHPRFFDPRSDREILLSIERKLDRLIGESEMADIFDLIIAGVLAHQSGNDQALADHVAAIDSHLSGVDASVLGLQGAEASDKSRLDAIEAGLQKVATAVAPANPGGNTTSGDQSGASANPGGDGSAPAPTGDGSAGSSGAIPTSGPGSETTGQVDQPDTQP
jgi:hypothetical protein